MPEKTYKCCEHCETFPSWHEDFGRDVHDETCWVDDCAQGNERSN